MNRRGFLGALGAAIAGATLDPERELWVPGKKLISIPRVHVPCGCKFCRVHRQYRAHLAKTLERDPHFFAFSWFADPEFPPVIPLRRPANQTVFTCHGVPPMRVTS